MNTHHEIAALAKAYGDFFESLKKEESIESYKVYFDAHSLFEDPFQKVKGVDAIFEVFQAMYRDLHHPLFVIDEVITQNDIAYLRWRFSFAFGVHKESQQFEGVSRVVFSDVGKVLSHQDYWDAASNVYEHIPLLGSLMRLIKKRIKAHHDR